MPHQAARQRYVDRLDDEEGRDVFDLAVRIPLRECDIGDDRVVRIHRIELAERAASDGLVGNVLPLPWWENHRTHDPVGDDARDARLRTVPKRRTPPPGRRRVVHETL